MDINTNISPKNLAKSVNIAKRNFEKHSRFTIQEFNQILDHVMNADFIEREFLHRAVPALTFEQVQAITDRQLEMRMEHKQSSSLLHEVMGGREGTGIDVTSYVVGVWGSEILERISSQNQK